ncbi:DNA-directed RNA polymerase I subunit RPA49 [Ambystoma mexicanum]|uniref:DNA-directed RNA polymerase I subunit RPA49 n=1 Tax=Ambystoma mexicanum TaxID=8296 RepID=UPI0037E77D54
MAAVRASWLHSGEQSEGHPALLAQFSNGKLQTTETVDFALYKHKDDGHPRKKHQRILTAETDRLAYVGSNFGTGALKCNTLCRYFFGILNKDSGQMEVVRAEQFNMQPVFPGDPTNSITEDKVEKTYRDKVDSLIEAFGTNKQKRALNARKMNQVGSETLSKAVTKAAENIIETKGIAALVKDAAQNELQDASLFLPPCHADAEKPEEVYKFDDLISPAEYAALETPSAPFRNITSEDIKTMLENKSYGSYVLEELQSMPMDEKSCNHKARCLWFLDTLIKFSFQKVIKRKHVFGPECPHLISGKLMKHFSVLSYNNGRLQNIMSASMKAKITAHVIALALHINDFQTDLTVLQRDMKLSENRMLEVARAMGLKISKKKAPLGALDDEDHKMATLTIPLIPYQPPGGPRKRKKMT